MRLIVGLGNPGRKYDGTRHNVGFEAVDLLAARHGLTWETAPAEAMLARWRLEQAIVVKPLTFMNASGDAVGALLRYFRIAIDDLFVIVDEVQMDAGRVRARASGSAGGHNGLRSIIAVLGTEAFPRLRIGVGRGDARRDLAAHVLSRIDASERATIDDAVGRAADAAETFVAEGIVAVMNRFNRRDDTEREDIDNRQS